MQRAIAKTVHRQTDKDSTLAFYFEPFRELKETIPSFSETGKQIL